MTPKANDFVLSGQLVLPTLLGVGTGSLDVFAVCSLLTMTAVLLVLSAGTPLPGRPAEPLPQAGQTDDQT